MKRQQMSAALSRSARRVGLKGGIVNTEGAHAIVMTFFPPLHNPPHPQPPPPQTVGDPGDPLGAAAAWNGIVTEAEHQDQRPNNRAASLAQKPNGSRQMVISPASGVLRRVEREASNRNCLSSTVLV